MRVSWTHCSVGISRCEFLAAWKGHGRNLEAKFLSNDNSSDFKSGGKEECTNVTLSICCKKNIWE